MREKPAGQPENTPAQRDAGPQLFQFSMWSGREIDPYAYNDALIQYMREEDEHQAATESSQARRAGMTRQGMHHAHTEMKVLTVPMLVKWANSHRVNPMYIEGIVQARMRRKKT